MVCVGICPSGAIVLLSYQRMNDCIWHVIACVHMKWNLSQNAYDHFLPLKEKWIQFCLKTEIILFLLKNSAYLCGIAKNWSESIIQMSKRVGKLKLSIKLSRTAKIVDPRKSSLVNVYKSSFISVSLLQFQSKIIFSISISKSFLTKKKPMFTGMFRT